MGSESVLKWVVGDVNYKKYTSIAYLRGLYISVGIVLTNSSCS